MEPVQAVERDAAPWVHHSTSLSSLLDPASFVFPVQEDVIDDESGHGFALRMAQANGLDGLPLLKKLLGKTRFAVLDISDAPMLSQWFGAMPQRLGIRLGSIATGKGHTEFLYAGHRLGRSYFINRMSPRVCVQCLQEDGYCRSAWDFALMTACPSHACSLLERCPMCDKDLSWDRPRLDTCQCGWTWRDRGNSDGLPPIALAVAAWIRDRMGSRAMRRAQFSAIPALPLGPHERALLNLMGPLSLNGGLHLLYALASAERCLLGNGEPFERKKTSIKAARDVMRQAADLVGRIWAAEPLRFRPSGVTVVTQLLAQAATHQADPADRSLAHSIIVEYLRQRTGRSNWRGRYPQLSQLEMFVEPAACP